jgi:hypothetical protein
MRWTRSTPEKRNRKKKKKKKRKKKKVCHQTTTTETSRSTVGVHLIIPASAGGVCTGQIINWTFYPIIYIIISLEK